MNSTVSLTATETFSGIFIDVSDPQPSDINLEDIAHALSNTCRYGGHCKTFYSVAEHAVFVSRRLEEKGCSISTQLVGLHHDDAEAYLGDIPRPIKRMIGDEYQILTDKVEWAIQQAMNLPHVGDPLDHSLVKEIDDWTLFVEADHFLPSKGHNWNLQPATRVITPDYWLGGIVPDEAKKLFLERHAELSGQ